MYPVRTPAHRGPRRAALVVVAALVASLGVLVAPSPAVADRPEAGAALDWLEAELAAYDDALPGFGVQPDWGITADAVLALAAGGRGDSDQTVATTERLLGASRAYGTWDDIGGGAYPDVRIAGALAKLLLVAEVQGVHDPADTDDLDLEAEVRAAMQTEGVQIGRFSDVNPHFPTDNANGFGQALAILGLSYTDGGVPAEAISFLVAQQCPGGGFRLFYGTTAGCEDPGAGDTDTTAMAVQALLVVERTPEVRTALIDAAAWLIDGRDEATGAFGGTGPTANVNSNSSGLIAQALRAGGLGHEVDRAADWVATMALTADNATGTPAEDDIGAIAYVPAALADALVEGIPENRRDQWRRSTPQAVLAFDLPDYGSIGRAAPEPIEGTRTSAESFVVAAYADFLDRAPTEAELADGVAAAETGASGRRALVRALATSDEWIGRLVTRFYTDTLGREPDAGGLAHWTTQLRTGRRTVAQVAAEFYGSNEYFQDLGGGTVPSWITDLYGKLLHRQPDQGGLDFWTARTAALGRVAVAGELYQSAESRRDRVTALYQDLLGRAPDPAGRDFWAGRILVSGDLVLAEDLASSSEYLTRAGVRFP